MFFTILGLSYDSVSIQVQAQPRNGEANQELLTYLSRVLCVKKSSFALEKGSKSRDKYVSISNSRLSEDDLQKILENELAES